MAESLSLKEFKAALDNMYVYDHRELLKLIVNELIALKPGTAQEKLSELEELRRMNELHTVRIKQLESILDVYPCPMHGPCIPHVKQVLEEVRKTPQSKK